MRIFLVSRCSWTLYNFRLGLLQKLKALGHTVVGGGASGDGFEEKIRKLDIPFTALPVNKNPISLASDLQLLYSLYKWYRTEKPDIVHHFTIKPVIYGSIAAYLARVPNRINTVTGLGYVFTNESNTVLRRIVQILYRISIGCSNVTFFLNRDDLDLFLGKKLARPEKVALLPGEGIDCNHFSPDRSLSNRKKQNTVLMISRLLQDKGIYEFIEAAKIVKKSNPHSRFYLLGRRDTRNPNVISKRELNNWIDKGIIEWLGEVSDVRPIIADSDIVVLPSYREGIPRSLMESAAMGKPLITTDAVGCREVVDNEVTGLLVPIKDSRSLANAIFKMLQNPEMRRSMGMAGRRKMKSEFDEGKVIERTLETYFQNQ